VSLEIVSKLSRGDQESRAAFEVACNVF
jgi:hypothetical protein